MAKPDPLPDPAESDAFDADLIAYIDGELDGDEAKVVADRLAADPDLRRRAEAYKKTFELLEYLPKPEPSPDFATRTITRLEPALPASASGSSPSTPVSGGKMPVAMMPNSAMIALSQSRKNPTTRPWLQRGIVAFLVLVLVSAGYLAHALLRPILVPARTLSLEDVSIIELLPLYLGVDSLEFLQALDANDYFGGDTHSMAAVDFVRPEISAPSREKLTGLFKSFSPTRQQQMRELHDDLNKLPVEQRRHLYQVLENYAVWLDRLPELDRHDILAAPNQASRLEQIQMTLQRMWRAGLPGFHRDQLKKLADIEEIDRKVTALQNLEQDRKEEWKLLRQQKGTPFGPFEDLKNPNQVDTAFVKAVEQFLKQTLQVEPAYLTDAKADANLPKSCRLTRDDIVELRSRYDAATKDKEWFNYGLFVFRLAERRPYLPEFGKKPPIVDVIGLRKELGSDFKPKSLLGMLDKLEKRPGFGNAPNIGKWPDFALEMAENLRKAQPNSPLDGFGPCRPGQFNDQVNQFYTEKLLPRLNEKEQTELKGSEGKWPEYPRQLIQLAKSKDLAVPTVTLPGNPSLWAKHYTISRSRKTN